MQRRSSQGKCSIRLGFEKTVCLHVDGAPRTCMLPYNAELDLEKVQVQQVEMKEQYSRDCGNICSRPTPTRDDEMSSTCAHNRLRLALSGFVAIFSRS